MTGVAQLIKGEVFEDERGKLSFANTFDMSEIVRFYEIAPKNQQIIRAWQGHKLEKKWFNCVSGSFLIYVVRIDSFDNPSNHLTPTGIELTSNTTEILAVPSGFATGIRSTSENSRLQVFSNLGLNESKEDDFRYPLEKWHAEW